MESRFCKDLTLMFGGTWHKRGHTFHIAVGSVIEYHTGLTLDPAVLPATWRAGNKPKDPEIRR